jgi:hypothetical protein
MIRLCNREGSYAEFLVYIAKPLQNINTVLLFMQGRVFTSSVVLGFTLMKFSHRINFLLDTEGKNKFGSNQQ